MCGRSRKNIKLIESATNTAIYFPPFAQLSRYCPPNANRRNPDEIFITGENPQGIELAKRKIHDLVSRTKLFMKDAMIAPAKIDSILLSRMDKVRKIMEVNGAYIMFPHLASQRNMIRVQGVEGLQIERTMKEIMSLVCAITFICSLIVTANCSIQGRAVLLCILVVPGNRGYLERPRRPFHA